MEVAFFLHIFDNYKRPFSFVENKQIQENLSITFVCLFILSIIISHINTHFLLPLSSNTENHKRMKLVILTGAGMSAESGIKTFRDSDGLWENYRIEDVCTPEALERNPELVINFYNERRKQLYSAQPNAGHKGLAELEKYFDVQIITQNIDDLHERAGSKKVLHLHGELKKVRSSKNPNLIYDLDGWELKPGTRGEDGSMLRPHVVFFGEAVPNIEPATEMVRQADIFVIIGTSLAVYPAASLLHYAPDGIPVFVIDPNIPADARRRGFQLIEKGASEGVADLMKLLAIPSNQHEK